MKLREEVVAELVRIWAKKAEEDLAVVRLILAHQEDLFDAAGFHAQQAVEKYLKALLTYRQIEFSKTHDIGLLLDLVANADRVLADELDGMRRLTPLAVAPRYPGEDQPVTRSEAEELLGLAETCRTLIRSALASCQLE